MASMAFGARLTTEINAAAWEALENAGCIFLPSNTSSYFGNSGFLVTAEEYMGVDTQYWSCTGVNAEKAAFAYFNFMTRVANGAHSALLKSRFFNVRLAQDY